MSDLDLFQQSRRPAPARQAGSTRAAAIAAGAVVGLAAATVGILSLLAGPSEGQARLAKLAGDVARMEAGSRQAGGPTPYRLGAVCASREGAAGSLEQRLQESAAAAGVTLSDMAVGEGGSNEASGLTAVEFQLGSTSRYDALVTFLGLLNRTQPEIFVDTADLTPQTSVATLKLTGRVLCWTIARQ